MPFVWRHVTRRLKAANSVSSSVVGSSPASSTIMLPDAAITRKQSSQVPVPTPWGTGSASRRLSRTIHIPSRPARSAQNSRSTSRSRSPMPPLSSHTSFSEYSVNFALNHRSSRILVDDPIDPIMIALYEIISVAMDVTDMTVPQLTAQPKICESIVQRVQNIGKAWDDHPDWQGRNCGRMVGSWEAILELWWWWGGTRRTSTVEQPLPSPSMHVDSDLEGFMLNDNDEHRVRIGTPPTITRKWRDKHPKDVARSVLPTSVMTPSRVTPSKPSLLRYRLKLPLTHLLSILLQRPSRLVGREFFVRRRLLYEASRSFTEVKKMRIRLF